MRIVVLSASPNTDGLTAACARAAVEAAAGAAAGVDAREIRLNGAGIGLCHACGNGWGTCQSEHRCQVEDGFQAIHRQVVESDALVLVTPVYWGEMSESAKAFTDRLRRCEASAGEASRLKDKPIIAVAAAGGSGRGLVSCLGSMERLILHLKGRTADLVSVNRWNRHEKTRAIGESAAAMVRETVGGASRE
ncbi:MAG: NAD(P)H-dependent oxidoreductase [Spirochaetes bacterium]|jgi:multimeric flavodoxin WrbA|nr:NAD(P)H-dependent oxidoreductase [Spirochaetota bacterium]